MERTAFKVAQSHDRWRKFRIGVVVGAFLLLLADGVLASIADHTIGFGVVAGWLLLVLPPFVVYLLVVKTGVGSVGLGLALLGSLIGLLIWLRLFADIDDGLEGLWIPFVIWPLGVLGSLLDFVVLQTLSQLSNGSRSAAPADQS